MSNSGTAAAKDVADFATAAQGTAADTHAARTDNPHAVTKTQVGLGNVDNTADTAKPVSTAQQTALDLKANLASPALTGNPTAPTQSAGDNSTKIATTAYADALIAAADAMIFKGVIDASANPNYPAADKGWTYRISVAGKIGGASGTNVEVGDLLICLVDGSAAGTQAAVGANWSIAQTNIDGAVVGPASAVDSRIALFDGTSGKLIKDSGILLSAKADLASPALTGNPTAPTQSAGDNSTKIATTAYADAKVVDSIADADTTKAPSRNAVFDALALKADLASPALTGNPTAPTPTAGDNDTSIATTAFVETRALAAVVDSIADADTTHAPSRNAVFDSLALKADLASPTFTGDPKAPTPAVGDNDTSIATTAFAMPRVPFNTSSFAEERSGDKVLSSSSTGVLVIPVTLPNATGTFVINWELDLFDAGNSATWYRLSGAATILGSTDGVAGWYATVQTLIPETAGTATLIRKPKVRYANTTGTTCYLILGDTTTAWNTMSVRVKSVVCTLGNATPNLVVGTPVVQGSLPTNSAIAEVTLLELPSVWRTSGTPEGTYADAPGALAQDYTNGVLYIKESGTSTTGWRQIPKIITATATLDFPNIVAQASNNVTFQSLTITVTGAAVGDAVILGPPSGIEAGLIWEGYVSATNTVTIRVGNPTSGAINPASATWRATVIK